VRSINGGGIIRTPRPPLHLSPASGGESRAALRRTFPTCRYAPSLRRNQPPPFSRRDTAAPRFPSPARGRGHVHIDAISPEGALWSCWRRHARDVTSTGFASGETPHRRDGFSAIAALPALVTFQLITVGSAGFSGSMSFLRWRLSNAA
jgi:hypothetical protein